MSKSKKSSQKKALKANKEVAASKNKVYKKTADKKTADKKVVQIQQTVSRASTRKSAATAQLPLLFGKQNYMLMLLGIGLITLGLLLMIGGHMPSRDVWDESLIYSARCTILAPFLILCGLVVEFFAIFRK